VRPLKVIYQVRNILGDRNPSRPRYDTPLILAAMERAWLLLKGRTIPDATLTATFLTIAAGDFDYALTDTYYATLNDFRLNSTGQPIIKRTLSEWMALREGNPSATGTPLIIAFSETDAGAVTGYLWPTPNQADTISALTKASADDWDQIGIFVQTIRDATLSLDMSSDMATAVQFGTAIELVRGTDQEGMTGGLAKEMEAALTNEKYRIARRQSGNVRRASG